MPLRPLAIPVAALILLTACGSSAASNASGSPTTSAATVPDTTPGSLPSTTSTTVAPLPRPDVSLPATLPTQLVVTDLTVGTGRKAAAGDTLVLHYIGELTKDGTVFDASYDRGTPITIVLGAGQVIAGWDRGLVGIQAGGRRQLDIPAELAYGDKPPADPIKAGDALTFVVDAVAIIPAANPELEPTVSVPPAANVESFTFTDLVVGDGITPVAGQKVAVQIVAYRADTGEKINSTWTAGQPFVFTFGQGQALLGLELTVKGMKVGGRRLATIPFTLAFGDAGSTSLGLPPSTDLVVVLDLVAAF